MSLLREFDGLSPIPQAVRQHLDAQARIRAGRIFRAIIGLAEGGVHA